MPSTPASRRSSTWSRISANSWRDYGTRSLASRCWRLVTERLASAGRHQHCDDAHRDMHDDLLLRASKGQAEDSVQDRQSRGRDVPRQIECCAGQIVTRICSRTEADRITSILHCPMRIAKFADPVLPTAPETSRPCLQLQSCQAYAHRPPRRCPGANGLPSPPRFRNASSVTLGKIRMRPRYRCRIFSGG